MQPTVSPDSPALAEAETDVLTLPASIDLTWADTLHHELQNRIGHDTPLLIDAAAVERVSTPCVQLLVAAALSARAHNLPFRLQAVSAALASAVHDLGLGRTLGMEHG